MTGPIEGARELPGYINCAGEKSPQNTGRALNPGCGPGGAVISTLVTEIEGFPLTLFIKVLRIFGFCAWHSLLAIPATTFGRLQVTNQTLLLDMPGANYNVFPDNSNIGIVSSVRLATGVNLLRDFKGALWGQYKEILELPWHARDTASDPRWPVVFGEYR